jgi:branched-chain amino acid transport system ATP-binding protein
MLELIDVRKSFDSLRAVDGVSLRVERGSIVGLIGPNGSGKSTLLNLIAGTQRCDSGQVLLDGLEISRKPPHEIFRLGVVRSFQDPSLFFRMTVLDNVLLPAHPQRGESPSAAPWRRLWRDEEKAHTLTAGNLLDHLRLRHQTETPASDLSGGQMKLLEIGRTLAGEPSLMLLDEPTAGVAPALAQDIFRQIAAMRERSGLTFLIIEHRLDILFDYVDSVYVMHMGKVIAQGAPSAIEEDAAVREVYFGE